MGGADGGGESNQPARLTLLAEAALTHELSLQRSFAQAAVVDGENTFAVKGRLPHRLQ